jgi:hypothetical protein
MKVRMKVKFMDWEKGDTPDLRKEVANRYIQMGVCSAVQTRKRKAAPKDKMVTGVDNK